MDFSIEKLFNNRQLLDLYYVHSELRDENSYSSNYRNEIIGVINLYTFIIEYTFFSTLDV